MNTTKIVRTLAAVMAVLMATLAFAPSVQADSTGVGTKQPTTLPALTASANGSGACPGPLVPCLKEMVDQYCQNSPTCHLVVILAGYVIDVVLDVLGDVITIAVWLIDQTTQLLYAVIDLVVDYLFKLVNYAKGIVAPVVAYLIQLLLGLVEDAEQTAAYLIALVGEAIKPFLDYAKRELAALGILLKALVEEVCWVVLGSCPWIFTYKRLTAQTEYAPTHNSWTTVQVQPATFASSLADAERLGFLAA